MDASNKYVIDLGNGYVRVRWAYLNKSFLPVMDEDLLWSYDGISKDVIIPKHRLEEMERALNDKIEKDKKLNRCASLNNKGIAYEKQGKIKLAIDVYERNIEGDCYPAHHSFDRLLIIYRKQKKYEDEKRVCQRAISVFSSEQKYVDRLLKIDLLINKQNMV